jgi:hypothetical protein
MVRWEDREHIADVKTVLPVRRLRSVPHAGELDLGAPDVE